MKIALIISVVILTVGTVTGVSLKALADSVSEFDLHYSEDHYNFN